MALISDLLVEVRRAGRRLRHAPWFATVAILTLGLGIAVATTIVATVDAVINKPIRAAHVEGTYWATGRDTSDARMRRIPPLTEDALALERIGSPSMATGAFRSASSPTIQMPGRAERMAGEGVTPGYAQVLRLPAQVGRWFVPAEDLGESSEPVAVVSDRLWRDWFAGDRAAVGTAQIRANGVSLRVIGVAPPLFRGLEYFRAGVDVWIPLSQLGRLGSAAATTTRDLPVNLLVRPADGTSVDAVAHELSARLTESASAAWRASRVDPNVLLREM